LWQQTFLIIKFIVVLVKLDEFRQIARVTTFAPCFPGDPRGASVNVLCGVVAQVTSTAWKVDITVSRDNKFDSGIIVNVRS